MEKTECFKGQRDAVRLDDEVELHRGAAADILIDYFC